MKATSLRLDIERVKDLSSKENLVPLYSALYYNHSQLRSTQYCQFSNRRIFGDGT